MENEFKHRRIAINPELKKIQDAKLKMNSQYIKRIMDLTEDSNVLGKIKPQIVENVVKPKVNFLTKIKEYFKGLFFKFLIEPELKRVKEQEELIRQQNLQKKIDDVKQLIYDTKSYENKKYFERLATMRKQSGGHSGNKAPLFFDPEAVVLHNEEPTQDKPSIFRLKDIERKDIDRQLRNQELLKRRVERLLNTQMLMHEI